MTSLRHIAVYLMLLSGISPLQVFVPGMEHAPWGLLCLILFGRANWVALLLALVAVVYLTLGLLYYETQGEAPNPTIIPMTINLLSPLFFFRGNERLIGSAARNVFWAYIIVGCLQFFSLLVPFENIMEFFIARFSGGPVGGGYRGVQMLETEPARASYQLFALFIIATSLTKGWKDLLLVPLVIGQVVLIASTTGLLITALYLSIRLVSEAFHNPKIAAAGVLGAALLIPGIQENPKTRLMVELYETDGLQGVKTTLAAVSGGRFLAALNAMAYIVEKPLGRGPDPDFLSGEKIEVDDFALQGYLTRASARPVSSTLTFTVVFGLPMLAFLLYAVSSVAGPFKFTAHVTFALAISVAYSPPFGEATLLMLLAAVLAANRGRAAAQERMLRASENEIGQIK